MKLAIQAQRPKQQQNSNMYKMRNIAEISEFEYHQNAHTSKPQHVSHEAIQLFSRDPCCC